MRFLSKGFKHNLNSENTPTNYEEPSIQNEIIFKNSHFPYLAAILLKFFFL